MAGFEPASKTIILKTSTSLVNLFPPTGGSRSDIKPINKHI